ncbi:unnamed protein product, partial [Rotaria magnacalcarata]
MFKSYQCKRVTFLLTEASTYVFVFLAILSATTSTDEKPAKGATVGRKNKRLK